MKPLLLVATLALAQHHSGYAGHEARDIKALSADEVKQYQSGAGSERELDRLFRSGAASEEALQAKVAAAGALRSEYRLAHLETHRRTRQLLSPGQVSRYDHLRGYADGSAHHK